jgi:hypothetical protein
MNTLSATQVVDSRYRVWITLVHKRDISSTDNDWWEI